MRQGKRDQPTAATAKSTSKNPQRPALLGHHIRNRAPSICYFTKSTTAGYKRNRIRAHIRNYIRNHIRNRITNVGHCTKRDTAEHIQNICRIIIRSRKALRSTPGIKSKTTFDIAFEITLEITVGMAPDSGDQRATCGPWGPAGDIRTMGTSRRHKDRGD